MPKRITSSDNAIWKNVIRLNQKKGRDQSSQYLIEGPNLIREALHSDAALEIILVSDSFDWSDPEGSEIAGLLDDKKAQNDVYQVSSHLFHKLSDTIAPQGILAVVSKKLWSDDLVFEHGKNVMILDRIQDPGNLGTMLRTADAAGYGGALILKGSGDAYGPKAVRAAAGSLFRLPIQFPDTPEQVAQLCKKHGKRIVCTTPKGNRDYFDIDMSNDIALVMGNEGNGIGEVLLEQADERVRLPMTGTIESLNVAVAAGILLYESVRQLYDNKKNQNK